MTKVLQRMKKISNIICSTAWKNQHRSNSTCQGIQRPRIFFLSRKKQGKYCVKCVKSCFHQTNTEVQVSYLGGSFRVLFSGRRAEKATRSRQSVTLCKHFGSRLQTTCDIVILVCCLLALASLALRSKDIFSVFSEQILLLV